MTYFITFSPSYQYILSWETLHFPVLHHCIGSVLCCKPNIHSAQGPKNDYTHAYGHPLSNSFTTSIAFLEPVSFLIINFPNFHSHPIASTELSVYYINFLQIEAPWLEHSAKNLKHSTYFKIKPFIYFFKASIALESSASILVFG